MSAELSWTVIGERVRRGRTAAGLSQQELAAAVGLERSMISKLESGDRKVDALELTQLAKVLDLPLGQFLTAAPDVVSRRAAALPETEEVDETPASRDTYRTEVLLAAWLRDVQQLVEAELLRPRPIARYPYAVAGVHEAREAAIWLREKLGAGSAPIESLADACDSAGQFVAVLPMPSDGASLVEGDVAVAVVNQGLEPGRRRSTAAHELGHLVLGDETSTDLGVHASRDEREAVVEAFAAEFLLPRDIVRAVEQTHDAEQQRDEFIRLSATHRVSWRLTLYQARQAGVLDEAVLQRLRARAPTAAEFQDALGWRPQPDLERLRVSPRFAHAVMQALKSRLITSDRAVEMMRGQISRKDLGEE